MQTPPLPPENFRRLVCYDDVPFEITQGGSVYPFVADSLYRSVFDFGCGCGRVARQLMCQQTVPQRYVGIDIHKGMIEWNRKNLTQYNSAFEFFHHDVWNLGLGNDNTRQPTAPFPVATSEFSFVNAHSVFTHVYKEQTEFYLREVARILTGDGIARTTWFLFDRSTFPMLFDFQVCLFVNEIDPTNAVIYDWRWLTAELSRCGLAIRRVVPPPQRGHQWELYLGLSETGEVTEFPTDEATLNSLTGSGLAPAGQPEPAVAAPKRPAIRQIIHFTGHADEREFREKTQEVAWWYHSYYFNNGYSIRGDYDIGADIANYGLPESMEGLEVLDVGTGAGWFAFYFEQLGAQVTTVDARGYEDFDVFGRHHNPPVERQPDLLDASGRPVYFSPVSRGFWVMRGLLDSKVSFVNSRVYDLSPDLFGGRRFDIVFLGALLCHLRDPIGALMAARSVCRGRVIATTPVVLGERATEAPARQYLPYIAEDKISWWLPNEACFRQWFRAAGFERVDTDREVTLKCDVQRFENGRPANGDQILRVGSAYVP